MEYWSVGARRSAKTAAVLMALGLALPLLFHLAFGHVPAPTCYGPAAVSTESYLRHIKEAFVLAGAVLAATVMVLSASRRRLHGRVASPGAGTLVAAGLAAGVTVLFLVDSSVFGAYFLAAAVLASWIGLITIIVLGIRAGSQARRLHSPDPWLRWGQTVGWYLLAVVLPVMFVLIAPWGPLCID